MNAPRAIKSQFPLWQAERIARSLGGHKTGGGWVCRCPAHDDNSPSLSISDAKDGTLLVCCHSGCDGVNVLRALNDAGAVDHNGKAPSPEWIEAQQARIERENELSKERAAKIWKKAAAIAPGGTVSRYLAFRGIDGDVPETLRQYQGLQHIESGCNRPAMVAAVTTWPDKSPHAVHRTFLTDEGQKVETSPKKMLGPVKGGAVRLAPLDPEKPLVLCEGLETGRSVQLATGFPVWACLSTGGLYGVVVPDPSEIKEIIVAADHDPVDEKQGYRPGEHWASKKARRLEKEGHTVRVAFPQIEGTDWNDVHMSDGLEAVRGGIEACEVVDDQEAASEKAPALKNGDHWGFTVRTDGVYFLDDKDEWRWLCSRLEVVAETRNQDSEDWGRLLRVTNRDGVAHEWPMPMEMLAGDGADVRKHLMSLGLDIASGNRARNRLNDYLMTARPALRYQCVNQIGWNNSAFVLPNATVNEPEGERIVFQTPGAGEHAYRASGTLDEWRDAVSALAVGNSRIVFAISCGFAAPLLQLVGAESGGFHFRGASSTGKSTALHAAGSVWGGGGIRGYIVQWRATDNALEAVAARHTDTLLCLDELGQVSGRVAGEIAYMLANGAGKARAGRAGEARKITQWRTLFLSTGEISIADKIAEEGRGGRAKAGQEVRVVDIPADAGASCGMFESLHGIESGDAFSRAVRDAAKDAYYGTAGPAFVERLCSDIEIAVEIVKGLKRDFTTGLKLGDVDGQVSRVADRFGLVAAVGELAAAYGLTGWSKGEAIQAVAKCFHAWLDARGGTEAAEIRDGIAKVRLFIEQHGQSRFCSWHGEDRNTVIARAGFWRDSEAGREYYFMTESWAEVCKGSDARMIARAMIDRGHLVPDKDGKASSRHKPPAIGQTTRLYHVHPSILGE